MQRVMGTDSAYQRDEINRTLNTTTMDAFSSEDAEESSGAKPNFIGRIVRSEPEDSEDGIKEEYKDEDSSYYEFLYEIDVLDKDWKNQLQYGTEISNNFGSKWMLLIGHLENIHGSLAENGIEGPEDLADALEGKVYEFREITFEEDEEFTWEESPDEHTVNLGEMFGDSENQPNEFLVPVREVDEEEVAEIDVEEAEEDVEEVDL